MQFSSHRPFPPLPPSRNTVRPLSLPQNNYQGPIRFFVSEAESLATSTACEKQFHFNQTVDYQCTFSKCKNKVQIKNSDQMVWTQMKVKNYKKIAQLLQIENKNLKDQNNYLIGKLKQKMRQERMRRLEEEMDKQYKLLYFEACKQIEKTKMQCLVYKAQAQNMKTIALLDIEKLKSKVNGWEKYQRSNVYWKDESQNRNQIENSSNIKTQCSLAATADSSLA